MSMDQSTAFKQPLVAVHDAASYEWRSGAFRRLPWTSLLAIIVSILGIGGWVAIVVLSSNNPVNQWTFQPSVYLAIVVAVVNILVRYAMSAGSTVFWWQRALQPSTTVGNLHRNWKQGNNFLSALKFGRNTTLIAFATIIVSLIPINGPLLQRSTTVAIGTLISNKAVSLDVNSDIPLGFSTVISGRGYVPTVISSQLYPIVRNFTAREDIPVNATGCNGICEGMSVNGAGFAVNCSSSAVPYYIGPDGVQTSSGYQPGNATLVGVKVFETHFYFSAQAPSQLSIGIQYSSNPSCEGMLQIRNCTLTAASVWYPVVIDGNKSTISLASNSHIFDDRVERMTDIRDTAITGARSTLGGVALALQNQYNSWANMRWVGAVGIEFSSSGQLVNTLVDKNNYSSSNCAISFRDPLEDLLAGARELMFRIAVATRNGTNQQTVNARETLVTPVWVPHYGYLGGAAALTLAAILAVIPTFNKYWLLGRDVSMSPVEVSNAFDAPMFSDMACNATGKEIVQLHGERSAVYGITEGQELRFGNSAEVRSLNRRSAV